MLLFRLFRQIHKVLGLLLSFLFLAWFLSGVVMIYHGFPRVNQQERIEKLSVLTALPPLDSLWQHLPAGTRANGLSVDMLLDRPVFHLRAKGAAADWYADSLHAVGKPDFNACAASPSNWLAIVYIPQIPCMPSTNGYLSVTSGKNFPFTNSLSRMPESNKSMSPHRPATYCNGLTAPPASGHT